MANKVFVDSDVIIDFFADRNSFAGPASILFDWNELGIVKIHISVVSINNIYFILRKYLGNKKSIQVIEELVDTTEIIGTTKKEITLALKNKFRDFEDSIQYSCAISVSGIEAIITRNIKDYASSKIAVLTAENYIKSKNNP